MVYEKLAVQYIFYYISYMYIYNVYACMCVCSHCQDFILKQLYQITEWSGAYLNILGISESGNI